MKSTFIKIALSLVSAAVMVGSAFAHVVVKPASVGVGAFQTFNMGVPSERESATVSVRIVIPGGLKYVTPTVKPGWTIEEKKTGSGETSEVTEIVWSGGEVPSGQRDDFSFSGQAPDKATTLKWKAYQTYADGTVVSWDQDPTAKPAKGQEEVTPFSQTTVVDDLKEGAASDTSNNSQYALVLSIVAIVLSLLGFMRRRK